MKQREIVNNYTVYMHTSPSNKHYFGITCQKPQKRWENGRGYKKCPAFYKAIQKYGWDNIQHTILFENLSKEEAERKEIDLIAEYKSNQKAYGYNIESGGNCAGTHSDETKRKISLGNKGKNISEETLLRMSAVRKGKYTGKDNPFYGRTHSEATKKKQAEFMKGNTFFKGHHHSDEFKAMKSKQMKEKYQDGGNPKCKTVIRMDEFGNIIEKYCSLREVARIYNVSTSTVCNWIYRRRQKEWQYE